jgi:NAD-dependent dihydropyrimidine dehydrogenase PreA subunit
MKNAYFVPNPATPNECITFDESKCVGCNNCVETCRSDVLMPNPEKGEPPIVLYPDECWFCGTCVSDCPQGGSAGGAIKLNHPLNMRICWKRKDTGEIFRVKYEYME